MTKFSIRKDSQNPRHVRFTVFEDGANCGQLTMTVIGWTDFRLAMLNASSKPIEFRELEPLTTPPDCGMMDMSSDDDRRRTGNPPGAEN